MYKCQQYCVEWDKKQQWRSHQAQSLFRPLSPEQMGKKEHYCSKTVDEVVTKLNGTKFFTIVNAIKGYWQVTLDEESFYLTNFSPPFGWYHLKGLPLGLVVPQDVFQKQLDTAFKGLDGVTGIADDTFVYGSSEVRHDRNLNRRHKESNLTTRKYQQS